MATTCDWQNLEKHGVTTDEVDEVLFNDPLDFDLEPSKDGNDRILFIGFTYAGRLLEVGVEYLHEEDEHIFHGMDATKHYRNAFEKRK